MTTEEFRRRSAEMLARKNAPYLCQWCGQRLYQPGAPVGMRRKFCSQRCNWRADNARRWNARRALERERIAQRESGA